MVLQAGGPGPIPDTSRSDLQPPSTLDVTLKPEQNMSCCSFVKCGTDAGEGSGGKYCVYIKHFTVMEFSQGDPRPEPFAFIHSLCCHCPEHPTPTAQSTV